MSFNVEIHKQYESLLYAVSSSDNTARVQTITREQNEFLYDLLTLLDKKVGHGILLNTSFNLDGKPILNKYADALDVLDTKDIDGVIFENYLIEKSK
jgi:carbamoyltransferase